jgi:hypothetical protein
MTTLSISRAQITFDDKPDLQITASDLTDEGIKVSRTQPIASQKYTIFNVITIPRFMIPVEITVSLDRTSMLAKKFETRYRENCVLGDAIFRDMSLMVPEFRILSCSIIQTGDFDNSTDPSTAYTLTISGGMLANTNLLIFKG